MGWREYWNGETPIYVSERHKVVHYRRVAEDIARLLPADRGVVLDFGCGEALSADLIADRSEKLFLCDGAETVRMRLTTRFRDKPNVVVLAPEDLAGSIAAGSLDFVVINSVVQYLPGDELRGLLRRLSGLLAPQGRLVIADVIPPEQSAIADAAALLRFAWDYGFFIRAVVGLIRTAFSGYAAKRAELGLSTYAEGDFIALLSAEGYTARRVHPNIGHNQRRMMFMAERTR